MIRHERFLAYFCVLAACFWLAASEAALGAGWSAPTTQTVYTLGLPNWTGSTGNIPYSGAGGSRDYPLVFKDGSYLYAPSSISRVQQESITIAAGTRSKALWGSTSSYLQVPISPPTTNGDKRLYAFTVKVATIQGKTGAGEIAPFYVNAATGWNLNNVEHAARYSASDGWYNYRLSGGTDSGAARTLPWDDDEKSSYYWVRLIVGYWRDGSTTRWKIGKWAHVGCDGIGARIPSQSATGTGVYVEKALLYPPSKYVQFNESTGSQETANLATNGYVDASMYWYLGQTSDPTAFDLWWDGGSAWIPSDNDFTDVNAMTGQDTWTNGDDLWGGGGGVPPSTWVTVTVPTTPSINASETSLTAGDFGNDRITEIWDRVWGKISTMLGNFTDWFWFLKIWDLENGWQ